jgi:hypothetical protein
VIVGKLVFIGEDTESTIKRMWNEGRRMGEIAAAVGISPRKIDAMRAQGEIDLPKRTQGIGGGQSSARPPAPSEIKKRCAAVRNTWDEWERLNRRVGPGGVRSPGQMHDAGERFGRWMHEQLPTPEGF